MLKVERKDVVEHQLKIFDLLPKINKPNIVAVYPDNTYEYEWVIGRYPATSQELQEVYKVCEKYLWISKLTTPDSLRSYLLYCSDNLVPFEALSEWICFWDLTTTVTIHGDLTVENIVMSKGHPVLLDASPPRGLSCRELDEAKMLQSLLTKWESIKRGWPSPNIEPPFEIRPCHIGLLLTHWIRIARHSDRHSKEVIKTARSVINVLIKFCKEVKNANSTLGYRWCLDRLKDFGLQSL